MGTSPPGSTPGRDCSSLSLVFDATVSNMASTRSGGCTTWAIATRTTTMRTYASTLAREVLDQGIADTVAGVLDGEAEK